MNSGFCDRLRQITFCIAINILKKKKINKIEIFEKLNKECPFYFTDFMKIKKYLVVKCKKKNIKSIKMNPYNSMININTCKKFNDDIKIDNHMLLNQWKKTFQYLEPKKKIRNEIFKLIKHKSYTAVHIRLTDKLLSFKDAIFELPQKDVITYPILNSFFKNILKTLNKNKVQNIYIASDENFYKKKLEKKLKNKGFKILSRKINYNKNKLRQTSGEDFVKDLFILSKAKKIISTTGGNVPLTASLITKKKIDYLEWNYFNINYLMLTSIRYLIYFLRFIISFNK